MWCRLQRRTKMSSKRIGNIEVLLEQLGSLQITNKTLDKTMEQSNEAMSVVPVLATMNMNEQAVLPKNIVRWGQDEIQRLVEENAIIP